jgi:hypothetical protein
MNHGWVTITGFETAAEDMNQLMPLLGRGSFERCKKDLYEGLDKRTACCVNSY